ncbi:hypothetical protein F441_16183 [Phytophthora nicotianae CJ01A1]|uniref:Uncharacterized protein n=5 Tax=Phytophthora nicotianae TaxID=4792 RepID=W2PTM9_PHYN3|nr:hypothetical protein PPTG_23825 [Phytophthora nicotianae INRA-310]ETI37762.1 hypothetical protein F443_16370 [Phytophthora nicotianae P1569]ETL84671.1 hypothetical protein L917_15604 [Phytophthora nicotianae]ETP07663.1 hypothetical protein F441_16183 [Phytophthora nicotianae CJ01A1]ETP35697.1 hypothetical protein F442_16216 [Phytophthora nicotianae P10297]ETN03365.1 hypothetical protein PPTG_23825 [Phytophthora nicotianae INRA-310]
MGKRALSKTTNGDFDVELPCTSIVIIKVYPWVKDTIIFRLVGQQTTTF